MKITVLCCGKLKESYWADAVKEYTKRLSRYTQIQIVEVADEKTDENASEKEEKQVLEKEGKRFLSKIPENAYCIALAIKGKTFDSVGLSEKLEQYMLTGKSDLYLLIGGSLGLSDEVLARCDEKWSFSALTFPHQMMRVILLEQLYRGFRIMKHEPYHK